MESRLEQLASRGHFLTQIALHPRVREKVEARDWEALDRLIANEVLPQGSIFAELRKYAAFTEIEFIISIRSSIEMPDEDGIWHDDGSRILAFSLSLTLAPESIQGGKLEIRRRLLDPPPPSHEVTTPPFGTMIIFATGTHGYEHRINRVEQGERIIIAGWCT